VNVVLTGVFLNNALKSGIPVVVIQSGQYKNPIVPQYPDLAGLLAELCLLPAWASRPGVVEGTGKTLLLHTRSPVILWWVYENFPGIPGA